MHKIIYFTKESKPTVAEVGEIKALVDNQYAVVVRDGSGDMYYGPRIENTDFVAGTVPDQYQSFPVWEPGSAGPSPGDPVTVKNSTGSATVQATYDANSAAVLPSTATIIKDSEVLQVPVNGTYTTAAIITVVGGVVTQIDLS